MILFGAVLLALGSCARAEPPSASSTSARKLRAIDGGPGYFARWPNSFSTDPSFFLIGVWFESVIEPNDITLDKGCGLNTYIVLTANSDLGLVYNSGMKTILNYGEWLGNIPGPPTSQAIAGWMLGDEMDMIRGPVNGPLWLAAQRVALPVGDGRFCYNNFGKGIAFWETNSEAANFVNNFQDVVSCDTYWFTDNDLMVASQGGTLLGLGRDLSPAETHIACNYGRTVDRVRNLLSPACSKPVFGYVEVAHESGIADWPDILPEQVVAAVWSCIIHGARGIVYFNHSFAGTKGVSQHCLRETPWADTRAAVTAVNARITALAPVLNAPFVDDVMITRGGVDVMAKWYGDKLYIFVQSTQAASQDVTLNLALAGVGNATATVLDENRSVAVLDGSVTDTFSDSNAVHIYRIDNPL